MSTLETSVSCDLLDDEFCETHFVEPSPVKKRNVLPKPSEWKEKIRKREELKLKMKQTESEFLTFLKLKAENKDNADNLSKSSNPELCDGNSNGSGTIAFTPEGRCFFDSCTSVPEPSTWFDKNSSLSKMTLEEFRSYLKLGILFPASKYNSEEATLLRLFCLRLLKVEEDTLVASLLLNLLSSFPVSYDNIHFKEWNNSSFSRLLGDLEKFVSGSDNVQPLYSGSLMFIGYTKNECRKLFRDGILAALDKNTFACTHAFPSFLSTCLQQSSEQFPISKEMNWIIDLKLKPEECTHLLKVLPQNEQFLSRVTFQFAVISIKIFLQYPINVDEDLDLGCLAQFLKENECKICKLPMNTVFHLLNILTFIIVRFSFDDEHKLAKALEELLSCVEALKRHYPKDLGIAYFVLIEAINRVCLTIQHRIPVRFRGTSTNIQSRQKLLMYHLKSNSDS